MPSQHGGQAQSSVQLKSCHTSSKSNNSVLDHERDCPSNNNELVQLKRSWKLGNLRIFPLKLIDLNKTAHPDFDMEPYQKYIILAMTSSNVAVGLIYQILLCRSFMEQGLSPINFLIGKLSCGIIMTSFHSYIFQTYIYFILLMSKSFF